MNLLRQITRLLVPGMLCLLPVNLVAQIHVIHVKGTLVQRKEPSEIDTAVTSVFDQSFIIIALDYEQLMATISKADGAPKTFAITTITQLPEGLDCAFMDETSAVVYSLKVVYLHNMEGKPVLAISWNGGKDNGEEYVLWSDDVTLY